MKPGSKQSDQGPTSAANAPQGRAGKAIVHPDDEYVDDPQEETVQRTNR